MTPFMTQPDADIYFADVLKGKDWATYVDADKVLALNQATLAINALNFLGKKTVAAQENQFPRGTDTLVPVDIQRASADLALRLLDEVDPETEFEALFMSSSEFDKVKASYKNESKPLHVLMGIPSLDAWIKISPYLRDYRTANIRRS
tara:strand:+ start:166 stop:609 length:444 start_codon:yes stop_codon:yes gene_type:complete